MVETEVHGNVLVIKINRPEARNAVNGDVAQGIEAGIDQLEADDSLWVGVLTGTREFFCAGADLKLINSGKPGEMMTPKGGFAGIVTRQRTKPIIAAVEGPALAGGLEIVLSCDLLVASKASRFGIPEVKRSLVAAAGGVFRLPRVLPHNVALELALTGDPIDAERAYQLGLVNELAEPKLPGRVPARHPADRCEGFHRHLSGRQPCAWPVAHIIAGSGTRRARRPRRAEHRRSFARRRLRCAGGPDPACRPV